MSNKTPNLVHEANVAGLAAQNKPAKVKKTFVNNKPTLDMIVTGWHTAMEAGDMEAVGAFQDAYSDYMGEI